MAERLEHFLIGALDISLAGDVRANGQRAERPGGRVKFLLGPIYAGWYGPWYPSRYVWVMGGPFHYYAPRVGIGFSIRLGSRYYDRGGRVINDRHYDRRGDRRDRRHR